MRVVAASLGAILPTLLVPSLGLPGIGRIAALLALFGVIYVPLVYLLAIDDTDRAVIQGIARRARPKVAEDEV